MFLLAKRRLKKNSGKSTVVQAGKRRLKYLIGRERSTIAVPQSARGKGRNSQMEAHRLKWSGIRSGMMSWTFSFSESYRIVSMYLSDIAVGFSAIKVAASLSSAAASRAALALIVLAVDSRFASATVASASFIRWLRT